MKFLLGLFLGALAMALFAYRSEIRTLIEGRKAISAGSKVAEGGKTLVEGVKDLIGELDKL